MKRTVPRRAIAQTDVEERILEAGIRSCENGAVMFGCDPEEGIETPAKWDLVRLAIPRRVYTQSHMDYVVEVVKNVWDRRDEVRPMQIVDAPETLRHYRAAFDWKEVKGATASSP